MKKTSPAYVIGFMIAICILCGLAVSSVQFSMKHTLDANARLARNRTIASAFNLPVKGTSAQAYETALNKYVIPSMVSGEHRQWQIYTTREAPHLVGVIISGMGFWDYITCILVLTDDLSTIYSFEIIEQKETPGLGARIEEPSFKRQFAHYVIDWKKYADRPVAFGEASGNRPTLNAITGATQTSLAVERFLNSELSAFKKVYDSQGGTHAGSER